MTDLVMTIELMKTQIIEMENNAKTAEVLLTISENAGNNMTNERFKLDELNKKIAVWKAAIYKSGY